MTAQQMIDTVKTLAEGLALRRRLDGLSRPGPAQQAAARPGQSRQGLGRLRFRRSFGKPVKIVNDALMQAIGSYEGGRMLFLGLGTGLGAAMIVEQRRPADGACASALSRRAELRGLCRRTRPGKARQEEMAQIRLRRRRAAARGHAARLRRHRRRQCREARRSCRPTAGAATTSAPSRAGFGSGTTRRWLSDPAGIGNSAAALPAMGNIAHSASSGIGACFLRSRRRLTFLLPLYPLELRSDGRRRLRQARTRTPHANRAGCASPVPFPPLSGNAADLPPCAATSVATARFSSMIEPQWRLIWPLDRFSVSSDR